MYAPAPAYAPRPQPRAATPPPARAAAPARPVVRAQMEDEPQKPAAPPPLVMPTPEELGVPMPKAAPAAVDWSAVRARLDRLGATAFSLETAATGYRFSCQLATRRVEGRGPTEAEAVRLALEQAEGK